jgi:hypothetical protein
MEQAVVAPKRIVMARRLKKPDGEVDFVLINQGCRGSRRAEDGSRRAMLIDRRTRVNAVAYFDRVRTAISRFTRRIESQRTWTLAGCHMQPGSSAFVRPTARQGDPGYNCSLITDRNYPRLAA